MGKEKAINIFRAHVTKTGTHTGLLVTVLRISPDCNQACCRFPSWRLEIRRHIHSQRRLYFEWSAGHGQLSEMSMTRSVLTEAQRREWERTVTIDLPSYKDPCKMLHFDISVLDTFPSDIEQNRETVVAIHGMPGTGFNFQSLGKKLSERGIRLVAPTCLGMKDSPLDLHHLDEIDFSPQGRAIRLRKVLKQIHVHRIDLLMAHSLGAWALYEAGAVWPNLGSLLAINPAGARPHRLLRPFLPLKLLASCCYSSLFRRMLLPLIPRLLRSEGFKDSAKEDKGPHYIPMLLYCSNPSFPEIHKNAHMINLRGRPLVVMYSLTDNIVEPTISVDMAFKKLGIPTQNTITYSEDKVPTKNPHFVPEGWFAKCLVFTKGGHLVHLAHEPQVMDQIEDLLKYVAQKRQEDSDSSSTDGGVKQRKKRMEYS